MKKKQIIRKYFQFHQVYSSNWKKVSIVILFFSVSLFLQCKSLTQNVKADYNILKFKQTNIKNNQVFGLSFLRKICGLWHGPVFSDTPAGSFDEWYVDFRAISPGNVSQFSTLDENTANYISFFIVKYNSNLRIAQRTYGVFKNKGCVTYEILDQMDEKNGYYRFSDFKRGDKRAYTEYFIGKDNFVMKVYTSKFNTKYPLTLHSKWEAELGDRTSALDSVKYFNFPQVKPIVDFTDAFDNVKECVYFDLDKDPYPNVSTDYLGSIKVNIKVDKALKIKQNDEFFLLLTTRSLFDGLKYKPENLKYISRYVFLPAGTKSYVFKNIHPGKYYLYSYNDTNGDRKHLSGDYMSSDLKNIIKVPANNTAEATTVIDFIIP